MIKFQQLKDKTSEEERKILRKSLAQVAQSQLNSMKHQYSIRPHNPQMNRPQSSISRLSMNKNNNLRTDQGNSRTPSREKLIIQKSHSQGSLNNINRKQLIQNAIKNRGGVQQTANFQLTFNKKGLVSKNKSAQKGTSQEPTPQEGPHLEDEIDKPFQIQNQIKKSPQPKSEVNENRIKRVGSANKQSQNSNSSFQGKHRSRYTILNVKLAAQSSSSSPQKILCAKDLNSGAKKRPHTSSPIQKTTPGKNKSSENHSKSFRKGYQKSSPSRSTSGNNRQSSFSIDRIVKENLKKQAEIQKQKIQIHEKLQNELKERKKKIEINNKMIRERNKDSIYQHRNIPDSLQQPTRDKSPRIQQNKPKFDNKDINLNRNLDAPQTIENREKQLKKRRDLGLEIFDLKRELGLGCGIQSSRGDISQRYNEPSQRMSQLDRFINLSDKKLRVNSASADKRSHLVSRDEVQDGGGPAARGGSSTHRKSKKAEKEMKKLVERQQREWIKKIKQQKMNEIIKHQKVLQNLKQLNIVAEQQRAKVKKAKELDKNDKNNHRQQPSMHFKTVDDQSQQDISSVSAVVTKKKRIVNIQVKPDGQVKTQLQSINYPETTKDQGQKSFEKLKNKNKKKVQPLRPKTAAGIIRVSIDETVNDSQSQQPKQKVIFSYFKRGEKENKRDNSISIINKSLSNNCSQHHLQHHSLITDRSQDHMQHQHQRKVKLEKIKESGTKMKHQKSKTRLIKQLMKQLEEHKQEIEFLKQNFSQINQQKSQRSKSKESLQPSSSRPQTADVSFKSIKKDGSKSELDKRRESSTSTMSQRQQRPKEEIKAVIYQNQSENINDAQSSKINQAPRQLTAKIIPEPEKVVIDDDMTIFGVLNLTATIIQRKFREYISKKKLKLPPKALTPKIKEESKNTLQDSARLENRILPVLKDQNPQNKRTGDNDQNNRKQSKHTFSFGHCEEAQLKYPPNAGSKQGTNSSAEIIKEAENFESQMINMPQNQPLEQHISFIIESSPMNTQRSNLDQDPIIQPSQQAVPQDPKILIETDHLSDRSSRSSNQQTAVDKVLKINDKFKFSLRSIAEKQKNQSIFDKIKKKKVIEKKDNLKFFINDDSKVLEKHQDSIRPEEPSQIEMIIFGSAREHDSNKDLINFSKLSIQVLEEENDQMKENENNEMRSNDHHDSLRPAPQLDKLVIIGGGMLPHQSQINESMLNSLLQEQSQIIYEEEKTNNIILPQDDTKEEREILEALNQPEKLEEEYSQLDLNQISLEEQPHTIYDPRQQQDEKGDKPYVFTQLDGPHEEYRDSIKRYQSQVAVSDSRRRLEQPSLFDYQSQNKGPNKQILRMIFGDEKFLQDHDYEFIENVQNRPSSPNSQSRKSLSYHESQTNPFLATNTSLFERNPFKDFTTNKLQDLLRGKNYEEVVSMQEEALKYHENLHRSYLNRMEKRQEASPTAIQRQRFELERWVNRQSNKDHTKQQHHQHINMFDLELERKQAIQIIQSVNEKAKEIKDKIQGSPFKPIQTITHSQGIHGSSSSNLAHAIEEAKSSEVSEFINKQLQQTDSQKNDLLPSNAQTSSDPKQTLKGSGSPEEEEVDLVLDLDTQPLKIQTQPQTVKQDISNEILDISIEVDEDEDDLGQSKKIEQDLKVIEDINNQRPDEEEKLESQTEQLTQEILSYFLQKELTSLKLARVQSEEQKQQSDPLQESPEQQQRDNDYDLIREIKSEPSPAHESRLPSQDMLPQQHEEIKQDSNQSNNLEEVKDQQESSLDFDTVQEPEIPLMLLGIDTSIHAIDQYIEEIFEQIRPRKEQFLQAFITPIYKNPLDVLEKLQKADFGQGMGEDTAALNLLDATSSLAYILNVQLYLTLEKAKENVIHEAIEAIRRQRTNFSDVIRSETQDQQEEEIADLMSEAQHIHNKVIFDCVNEGFNMVRPYGSAGEPMPWSRKPRRNVIFMFESPDDLDKILNNVKANVIAWARIRAGALPPPSREPRTQTMSMPLEKKINNEDPALTHQRERCLAQLLATDLVKEEEKWLDYENEEAQVKIDLSDIVLDQLVGEVVNILQKLGNRKFELAKQ